MSHTMYQQAVAGTSSAASTPVTSRGSGVSSTDDDRGESGKVPRNGALLREPLWMVQVHDRSIRCELRYSGQHGVEYRLFRDNEFYQGRGFRSREPALLAANAVRRQLEGQLGDQAGCRNRRLSTVRPINPT